MVLFARKGNLDDLDIGPDAVGFGAPMCFLLLASSYIIVPFLYAVCRNDTIFAC